MKKFLLAVALCLIPVSVHAQTFTDHDVIKGFAWQDDGMNDGAVLVRVDITKQMVYVYKGDTLIALSAISTGRVGHRTPVGIFPIMMKDANHRSNLYHAPMPFTEMLTSDGVALHAGIVDVESHGCVHLPLAFAKKLFSITHIGDTVSIENDNRFELAFKGF